MIRKIIKIDESKCDGCGLCFHACHEGAIGIVGGKAKLLRDDYCDGLGDCLPACPTGAITWTEREAAEYDAEAVKASRPLAPAPCHCPGADAQTVAAAPGDGPTEAGTFASELRNWPVQIKLAPAKAPFFDGADLLVAADCAAYARAGFHGEYMHGRAVLIGCPKLDGVDYSQKLSEVIEDNSIKSLTVVRMEVPCCGGLEHAVATALKNSGKGTPLEVVTLGIDGGVRGGR